MGAGHEMTLTLSRESRSGQDNGVSLGWEGARTICLWLWSGTAGGGGGNGGGKDFFKINFFVLTGLPLQFILKGINVYFNC